MLGDTSGMTAYADSGEPVNLRIFEAGYPMYMFPADSGYQVADGAKGTLAYCINMGVAIGGSSRGTKYTKYNDVASSGLSINNLDKIKYVILHGYQGTEFTYHTIKEPSDWNAIHQLLKDTIDKDEDAKIEYYATQAAVWHYTNNADLNNDSSIWNHLTPGTCRQLSGDEKTQVITRYNEMIAAADANYSEASSASVTVYKHNSSGQNAISVTPGGPVTPTEKVNIKVNKKWENGATGESAEVELYAGQTATGQKLTLNEGNNWSGEFKDLDKYDSSGNAIEYTVKEIGNNYKVTVTKDNNGNFTVSNSPSCEKTKINVIKEWTEGAVGEKAVVELYADKNPTGKKLTLTKDNNWQGEFEDLQKYGNDGHTIDYTVVEEASNYDVTYNKNGDTITVSNAPKSEKTRLKVNKVFADGATGESAEVELYAGQTATGQKLTLNEGNNWSGEFKDLDKYDIAGNEINYTVKELGNNYKAVVSKNDNGSVTVTNYPSEEKTKLNVVKNWTDGASGEKAEIRLYQDGKKTDNVIVLDESNGWKGTFDNLKKYGNDGHEIAYTAVEETNNYKVEKTQEGDTVTFSNSPSTAKTSLKVNKEWAQGATGESAEVELLKDGEPTGKKLTLNEANGWKGEFTELAKYGEDGHVIVYSVKENTENYAISYTRNEDGSITVSNSPKNDSTSLTVKKEWIDGASGESAEIVLLANNKETAHTLTLSSENQWTGTFDNLPKHDASGNEITYTVKEKTNNYKVTYTTNSEDGSITVSNAPNPEKTSVNVKKVWANGASGEKAEVELYAGNTPTGKKLKLSENNQWKGSFGDLDKYGKDGKEIIYTVKENTNSYDVTYSKDTDGSIVITNSPSTEKTSLKVNKEWADGASGEEAEVQLYADNEPTDKRVKLNAGNGWSFTFEGLAKYDASGRKISYSVNEITNNYKVTIKTNDDGSITVTNSPKEGPQTTSVSVHKSWVGTIGDRAEVQLLADGEPYKTVVLNQSNQWSYTFTGLPVKDNYGKVIQYTVTETPQQGYTASITGTAQSGFEITNTENTTPVTDRTSVNVRKVWQGRTGEKAVVNLFADGTKIQTIELNEGNGWQHTFSNLPKYNASGVQIVYTITEDEQEGYITSIIGSAESGFVVTNTEDTTIRGGKTKVHVEKKWIGEKGDHATVHLLANGEVVQTVELNEDNNWEYEFAELPTVDEKTGEPIVYTVSEDQQKGYTATIKGSAADGFVITNAKSGTRGDNGRTNNGGSSSGTRANDNGKIVKKTVVRPAYGPKTGDSSDIALYMFLVAGAAAAAAVVHFSRKREF